MAAEKPVRDRFVGVWDLVSYHVRTSDGEIRHPYGNDPLGRISYDDQGHMSAQLMRRARENPPAGTSPSGFSSYYGTYTVDEKSGTVVHEVQGAWLPSWIGTKQVRYFQFAGDRLTLEGDLAAGRATLVWQRTR